MKYLFTLVALSAFSLTSFAQTFEWNSKSPSANEAQTSPAYDKAFNERQIGLAGFYPVNKEGRQTASGEIYASGQMTASHGLLPFGTILRVQNLENGRTVDVRVNDKGHACASCLVVVSAAAAQQLGITYRSRVAVERTGFSNWNPNPNTQPSAYAATPNFNTVARPVQIQQNNQWDSRGVDPAPSAYGNTPTRSPLAYGTPTTAPAPNTGYNRPSAYGTPTPTYQNNYTTLGTPSSSVMSREVQPATVSRQPATYSRYPTAVTPTNQANTQPRAYQPAPQAAGTTTYAPVYQPPSTVQPAPAPVQQATPPPSTVMRYQENRTVPAPTTYSSPRAYNPPSTNTQLAARGIASPVTTTASPATTA
ncbi:MAG: RlpA-like double-psi beta-barrel domain-containing protein, partial [Bacteroidota bacterium]